MNVNIGLSADKKTVYVSMDPEALPAEATDVLTDFKHNDDANDALGDDVNHVLYHHVRDALYHEGIYDMQRISIVKHGELWAATGIQAAAVADVEVGATATLELSYFPSTNDADNDDFTYVSSDPTKATVSAAGVVTGVAIGDTVITVTHKTMTNLTVDVPITVIAAG